MRNIHDGNKAGMDVGAAGGAEEQNENERRKEEKKKELWRFLKRVSCVLLLWFAIS